MVGPGRTAQDFTARVETYFGAQGYRVVRTEEVESVKQRLGSYSVSDDIMEAIAYAIEYDDYETGSWYLWSDRVETD